MGGIDAVVTFSVELGMTEEAVASDVPALVVDTTVPVVVFVLEGHAEGVVVEGDS